VINVIRAHLAEFGIVAPVGRKGVEALLDVVFASIRSDDPQSAGII
jgi:transposase